MEDSKKDETLSKIGPLFQTPWVRALVAFIIFISIFWAGARFGAEYGQRDHYYGTVRDGGARIMMGGGYGYDAYPEGTNMMYRVQNGVTGVTAGTVTSQSFKTQPQTITTKVVQ